MNWFTATVIGVHHDASKIDIQLPNGDKFLDVVIAYEIGKSEKCFGYKQVQEGCEVIVLKNEGNSLIAIGQTSQTPSQAPSSMSETEVAQSDLTEYMKLVEEMFKVTAQGLAGNSLGITALGGVGAGAYPAYVIYSDLPKLLLFREKMESMQKSDACY